MTYKTTSIYGRGRDYEQRKRRMMYGLCAMITVIFGIIFAYGFHAAF
ncbi:hypothetical protein [Methanohalobium sp.]|nr:hypothetical protein [Methanohalobium sp.]